MSAVENCTQLSIQIVRDVDFFVKRCAHVSSVVTVEYCVKNNSSVIVSDGKFVNVKFCSLLPQ